MTIPLRWRRSTSSQNGSTCVELAHTVDAVRDSKNPDGPTLSVPGLPALLTEIKHDRMNR